MYCVVPPVVVVAMKFEALEGPSSVSCVALPSAEPVVPYAGCGVTVAGYWFGKPTLPLLLLVVVIKPLQRSVRGSSLMRWIASGGAVEAYAVVKVLP